MKRIPFPMVMMAAATVLAAADIDAQRAGGAVAGPTFDVISVKRVARGAPPSARPMSPMGDPPG